jgi:hypothetical protein
VSAPRNPAGPNFEDLDETGGSLGIGTLSDGDRPVSASLLVTGLAEGQTYVVFGWWSVDFADRMTLTIDENACIDGDGDGAVACNGCSLGAGETCGECDDANPTCTTSCADADQDGVCPPWDCDDGSDLCTDDCADFDGDDVADCEDTCIDLDDDGYGNPGGAGDTCSGSDCDAWNPLCNVSCVDGDADAACPPADCADDDPSRPGAAEINDCADQQCPGEPGHGIVDETSGESGFHDPSKDRYSWPPQQGATDYQAVRSSTPDFSAGCTFFTTQSTLWIDPASVAPGQVLYYLNRPLAPCPGSWGETGAAVERIVCGGEVCTNGVDDDADLLADCEDPDCASHPTCQPAVFTFVDTPADDVATSAFAGFLTPLVVESSDYFYFEIDEAGWGRIVAWCAENAAFYRTAYLTSASSAGTISSGTWTRWYRAPSTGNTWSAPWTSPLWNHYGDDAFGEGSWCSEQFPFEPQNCLFPNRTNDCEAYDQATGACAEAVGLPWTVTIRIGPTRSSACGF